MDFTLLPASLINLLDVVSNKICLQGISTNVRKVVIFELHVY
jgi:hypothetical protein